MRFDLKIRQIGLILVSVPLVFELLFVALLTYSVRRAEGEIKRQELARDIVYCASSISTYAAQCGVNVGGYSISHSDYFKNQYQENETMMMRTFDQLERLLADDPKQLSRAREARLSAQEGAKLLHGLLPIIDRGYGTGEDLDAHGRLASIQKIIDNLRSKLKSISNDEVANAQDSPRKEAIFRRLAQSFLVAGILANIVIAIGLAFFFAKSIASKINCISDNAARVPRGEPLSAPLVGSDEISHLDHIFHNMVDELDAARKMQQYLIAMVSHDLRSPLTSLQAVLVLLSVGAGGELPEAAQKKVEMALRDLDRLIKLTNDLLDTERLASGQLQLKYCRCLLSDVIEEALASVSTYAQQYKISLSVDDAETNETMNLTVDMDPERIGQVLTNLLTNAIKYSPANTSVQVSASRATGSTRAEFVKVMVMDEGRGVPREFQSSIFEKFQQVEESDSSVLGGKGLGLAICKSIVEQHSGQIGVLSRGGQGSIFWFEIPIKAKT